ncbi:3-carboxy-cis,cis-mucoante lactonizing enzyme [Ceratobasidium sp. AG-I]|nr:3-carboxy-cis,cis-mucoante lactonizing enzyme [Ceratobasidium sp. AG-I]
MIASKVFTLLVGGYSSLITSVSFDPSLSNLTVLSTSDSGANPSWITTHPLNCSVLIGTNELNPVGGVSTFKITDRAKGTVTRLDNASSFGADPAFVAGLTKARQVAVMDYSSGTGAFIPLGEDLLTLDEEHAQKITFNATVSHPHQVVELDDELLVPDLGADKVWRLTQDPLGQTGVPNWQVRGFVQQPTGSGPRHVVVSNGILYTLHELASTLSSQTLPALGSGVEPETISTLSIVPEGADSSTFGAAELIIDEARGLLYASNRLMAELFNVARNLAASPDPRGDTIAIFSFDAVGKLALVNQVYTGLNRLRAVAQGGPNDQYIAAAGQTGGGLAVFEKLDGGRNLVARARLADGVVQAPSSFVWL